MRRVNLFYIFILLVLIGIVVQVPFEKVKAEEYVEITEATFPDSVLRECILSQVDHDKNGKLSQEEISSTKELYIANPVDRYTEGFIGQIRFGVKDIKGIELFTNLVNLKLSGDPSLKLDVSKMLASYKNLKVLELYGEMIIENIVVPINSKIEKLSGYHAYLQKVDVRNAKNLSVFEFYNNGTYSIDLSKNKKLRWLSVNSDGIVSLNLRNNPLLKTIDVTARNLKSLNVTKCKKLENLYCYKGSLKKLKLSNNKKLKELLVSAKMASPLYVASKRLIDLYTAKSNVKKVYINRRKKDLYLYIDKATKVVERIVKIPARPKAKKKGKKVTWRTLKHAKKYEIYFSKTKKGTFKKYKVTKKAKVTLKKKGYVKVRGVTTGYGTNWYGKFSKIA